MVSTVNFKIVKLGFVIAVLLLMASATKVVAQDTGYLKCYVNAGRAGVFVNDKSIGPPKNYDIVLKYALPAGTHKLRIEEPRFETFETTITITAGETTKVRENLAKKQIPSPPFGQLRTIEGANKFSAVYLNEAYMGHVDEFSNFGQRLLLPPGNYQMKVEKPDNGLTYEETITIDANQTTTINLVGKGV
jgi:hypothetical protein